ncbi:MAG: PD-(D/E)XK nuclease family protein [Candidatus Peribacteraceae bacterium]|nr:PD-(D/E)XK nuclease family protein [Candidatus Peribacteraceae bacterium]
MNKKVRRPSGPFPSLPSGMDNILKVHFDKHRKDDTLPEELAGKFEGRLFRDVGKLDVWRNNFRGLRYLDEKSGITLTGALDDLFVTSDSKYAPLDFKTRGFPRKEDTHKHYQHQMDLYSFLLEKNSMDPANYAILIFYHPLNVEDNHNVIFNADTVKVPVDRNHGEKIFLDAIKCILGDEPKGSDNCNYCKWNLSHEVDGPAQDAKKKNNLSDFI